METGIIQSQNVGQGKEKGEAYSYSDQELIRQLVKSRLAQKSTLEYEDLDGYVLPPRTQFSMLKKPAVSIKYGRMLFNMACIRLFEEVEHILPIVHPTKKRLTIVMCAEEEAASVAWARKRQKDEVWVNKDVTSEEFVLKIFRMMGWNLDCRYKALGRIANSREGLVLVFDLEEAIMFTSKPLEIVDKETGEIKKKQVKYYPDAYKDCIGKSFNDYKEARQMNMFEYLEEYSGQTYSDVQEPQSVERIEGEIVTQSDYISPSEGMQQYSVEQPVYGGGQYE